MSILVTGGFDECIKIWDLSSEDASCTLPFPESQVNKIAIAPNKMHVAAAGNPMIKLFEVNTNNTQPVSTFTGHKNNVTAVGFQRECRWLYSGSEDGTVKIWDLRSLGSSREIMHSEPCTSVSLHPNQKYLLCSYQNGELRVYDQHSVSVVLKSIITEKDTSIQCVDIDPSGNYCCAVNNKGTCFLYSIEDNFTDLKLINRWNAHDRYITSCVFSPNSKYLSTTSADHKAKIWMVKKTDNPLYQSYTHSAWVWDSKFTSNSKYIITVGSDHFGLLREISPNTNDKPLQTYRGHAKSITCVAIHDTST